MTPQAEMRLKDQLKYGEVELTIVDDKTGDVTTESHSNFDEARSAIEFHLNHAGVYF